MFSPEEHGFLKLDFMFPGDVQVYEHIQSGLDQTNYDTMRLNTYLSQDGDFVTVWWGLIDAVLTGFALEDAVEPSFSFQDHYEENLFRGYISDNETGAIILKALRFADRTPNVLSLTADGKLECHALAS